MGNSFSTQFEWSVLPSGNNEQGTLSTSLVNQELLTEISKFVDFVNSEHPHEAKVEFKRPLTWSSTFLKASKFGGNLYTQSAKSKVVSFAEKSNGEPLFTVENLSEKLSLVKVSNFEYLQKALAASGDRSLYELQEAIQANPDPVYKISGVLGQSGRMLLEAFDRLSVQEGGKDSNKDSGLYKLLLLLNQFEVELLQLVVRTLKKERVLDMPKVVAELELVQSFVSRDLSFSPLKSIGWESDYIFANGFRAPPWRQVYGELAYIEAAVFEKEVPLIVTASRNGYFVNNGYSSSDQGKQHLDYAPSSPGKQPFPTLIALLKESSPTFNQRIEQQIVSQSSNSKRGVELKVKLDADSKFDLQHSSNVHELEGNTAHGSGAQQSAALAAQSGSDKKAVNGNAVAANGTTASVGGSKALSGKQGLSSSRKQGAKSSTEQQGATGKKVAVKANSSPTRQQPSIRWRALGQAIESVQRSGSEGSDKGLASSRRQKLSRPSSGSAGGILGDARVGCYAASSDEEDFNAVQVSPGAYDPIDSDEPTDEEVSDKRNDGSSGSEMPAEYWQIQKMIKYLRCGNQTATIIAICALRDYDLTNETNQLAVRDVGGLNTLINLLDTEDPKCKIGALKILKDISQNIQIRAAIADLDGMQPLVSLLKDPDQELKCLAAETIGHCAKNAHNRHAVSRYGGIRRLVRLLKGDTSNLAASLNFDDEQVAISGAGALAVCSKSKSIRKAIQEAGAIPLLAQRLASKNEKLLIPVVGILQECASDEKYRLAIRQNNMISFLVEHLQSNCEQLQAHCATAIFKCAENDETRIAIRKYGGLELLSSLLDSPQTKSKELLIAATGAIWKCAQNSDNLAQFNKLNVVKKLVGLMHDQPEEVLANVVGGIGVSAQSPEGRQAIRECNGITGLVSLLTNTNHALLVNVTRAIGACALDTESMVMIDKLDAVRLLWSLLKSSNLKVQASAAWAISPCIEHAKDAGEMVRSFVGGLELIVSLLKSEDVDVLASICAAIANIAKDEENLAVITDHGVVPMLAKLTTTKQDKLRKHLAEAIARCCPWGNNKVAFGAAGAVAPLVNYLHSKDSEVHKATARALYQLSTDPDNCVTMHESGVVQLLLGMVGSTDAELQEAAAGTIAHIRKLALASEKAAIC